MTFISIIIPFNKGKRYLKDCLDSLSEQNLDDEEVILIINGNEDISDLIENYKLNIIKKEFNNEITVGKARNEGLKIATGKYIYFIDSDDYIYSNGLSKLINIAKETDADFINGERINTSFIKDRFEEEMNKKSRKPLMKNDLTDEELSIKFIVGEKTNKEEFISALHSLIKRGKIGDIKFNEEKRYYTDYEFIKDIVNKIESFIGVENAIYAKRIRDDPINLTSLNQEPKEDEFLLFTTEYENVKKELEKSNTKTSKLLKSEMENKLLKFYSDRFSTKFNSSPNKKWRGIYFNKMAELSKDFDLNKLNQKQKREIKALQTKNKKKLRRILKIKSNYNKIKKIRNRTKLYLALYNKIYNKKPINENKIMFESFRGDFYTDSPKYIYEYLYNNYNNDYEFVWVINDLNTPIPGNPKKVKRFSLNYYKELATSKYWVINGRQPGRFVKRKEQKLISTWHGTPLKKLGLDIENVYTEDPKIKKSYVKVAKEWDYLISPNEYTKNILKSAFAYEGEILETGYPRNDILYNADDSKISEIKEKLNIPTDKKIILYAPTWRDDEFYEVGKVKFQLKLELDKMKESLSDDYILLLRTHYFIADNIDLTDCEDFAFYVSKYDDIAELYLISDILITDYSSVFFDYANLKRPIIFYTYDLEKYENVLRGFYIDIHSEVPGPLVYTTEEVIDKIKDINLLKEEYKEKYEQFYNRFCSIEDGNASKRIVESVWKKN